MNTKENQAETGSADVRWKDGETEEERREKAILGSSSGVEAGGREIMSWDESVRLLG